MPYVKQDSRTVMDDGGIPINPGELAYMVTRHVNRFLGYKPNFAKYAEALGVLEAVKLELYRRKIAVYEEEKMKENGDVF